MCAYLSDQQYLVGTQIDRTEQLLKIYMSHMAGNVPPAKVLTAHLCSPVRAFVFGGIKLWVPPSYIVHRFFFL